MFLSSKFWYIIIVWKWGSWPPCLKREKDQKKFLEGRKKRGEWNFYDRKMICKINYCENKVKLNNKDNSKKNNVNEIKEII